MKILGKGMFSNVLNSPFGLNTLYRYITELSAAGSMYDQFSSPVVLEGDFEWEMEYFGSAEGYATLIASSDDTTRVARVDPDGTARAYAGSFSVGSSTVITDNKSHVLGAKRAGQVFSLYVDRDLEDSVDDANTLGPVDILYLLKRGGTYTDGGWLNLKIWTGGDRTTGTLVVDAKKDEDGSTKVIGNAAATLGAEESQNIFVSIDTTDAYTDFEVTSTLSTQKTYLITVDVQSREAGSFKINTATTDSSQLFDIGVTELIVTGTTFSSIQTGGTGFTGVAKISTREIPSSTPLLTRVNQTTAEVTKYAVTDDGYLGPELEPQPLNLNTWNITTTASLVSDTEINLGSGPVGNVAGGAYKDYEVEGTYRVQVEADSEGTVLQLKDSPNGLVGDPVIVDSNPIDQTLDYSFTLGGLYFRSIGSEGDRITVDKASVKRIIEVA
jgi:hypothetical protein